MRKPKIVLISFLTIVVVCVLTGIGIYMYENAVGKVYTEYVWLNDSNLEPQKINTPIENFGKSVQGKKIEKLVQKVNLYNDIEKPIYTYIKNNSHILLKEEIDEYYKPIYSCQIKEEQENAEYAIKLEYDIETHLISKITIKEEPDIFWHENQIFSKNFEIEKYEGLVKVKDIKELIKIINSYNEEEVFPQNIILENESDLLLEIKNENYKIKSTKAQKKNYYKVEITQYGSSFGEVKKIVIKNEI